MGGHKRAIIQPQLYRASRGDGVCWSQAKILISQCPFRWRKYLLLSILSISHWNWIGTWILSSTKYGNCITRGGRRSNKLAVAGCCNIYVHHYKKKIIILFAAWMQHCLPCQRKRTLARWGQCTLRHQLLHCCFNSCYAFYIGFNTKKWMKYFFFYYVASRGAVPVVLRRQKLRLLSLPCHPRVRKVN